MTFDTLAPIFPLLLSAGGHTVPEGALTAWAIMRAHPYGSDAWDQGPVVSRPRADRRVPPRRSRSGSHIVSLEI